jgi:hypothetical protein
VSEAAVEKRNIAMLFADKVSLAVGAADDKPTHVRTEVIALNICRAVQRGPRPSFTCAVETVLAIFPLTAEVFCVRKS